MLWGDRAHPCVVSCVGRTRFAVSLGDQNYRGWQRDGTEVPTSPRNGPAGRSRARQGKVGVINHNVGGLRVRPAIICLLFGGHAFTVSGRRNKTARRSLFADNQDLHI